MKYSDNGLALTAEFEGLKLTAYQDSVGVWTIGYGHTKGVKPGDKITQYEALNFLRSDVKSAEDDVNRLVKVPLTQNQFDALVDFTFNLGGGALARSTLLTYVNARNFGGAALEFHKWNQAGGKVLEGLKRRRRAEADLFVK